MTQRGTYGGDFPADLPDEAGATHIGMFVAWAWLTGLANPDIISDIPETLDALNRRTLTPGRLFLSSCDGKFIDEDLSVEGNAFATDYFNSPGKYVDDYTELLANELPSAYHVPDTWDSYDRLKPRLDQRFREWSEKSIATESRMK